MTEAAILEVCDVVVVKMSARIAKPCCLGTASAIVTRRGSELGSGSAVVDDNQSQLKT